MNALIRWGKFNVVGAMGMAVQLGALALHQPLRGGPLPGGYGCGAGADAAAQLCVAPALHMARPPRPLRACSVNSCAFIFRMGWFRWWEISR